MKFQRSTGILLHPTSLPSPFAIGDFGPGAFSFVDFLEDSGQSCWQLLPLSPTGYGDSPYQSISAFAGNPLLISPQSLVEEGLITSELIAGPCPSGDDRVDFGLAGNFKKEILQRAFATFSLGDFSKLKADYRDFSERQSHWLDDFALFAALKEEFLQGPWWNWPDPLKRRDAAAVEGFRDARGEELEYERFTQFLFHRQWSRLKSYANSKGIEVIGDLPIFVAMDSVDVWKSPSDFKLRDDLTPKVVAGVPPDYFSKTGQLWGNPIYDWHKMREGGFAWWVSRMRHALAMFDFVRIDHFRGFCANYEVPATSPTAETGEWVPVPGRDLFATMKWALGELPLIAEDLGFITDDVRALRDEFGLPGMKILQYAWGGGPSNEHLPHNYSRHCVAYTGTHDNATAMEWFADFESSAERSEDAKKEFEFCLDYLDSSRADINWSMIRALYASVADTVIVPLQDVFGAGAESRMNTPSTVGGNWAWRFRSDELSPTLAERLSRLSEVYGRR